MAIRNNNISSRKIYIGTGTEVVPNDGDALITGNVGIGTTSPAAKLEVNGGTSNVIARLTSTDVGSNLAFVDSTTTGESVLIGASGNDLVGYAGGGEKVRAISFDGSTVSSNSFNSVNLRLVGQGKSGWGVGDVLGQLSFYNTDGSGIGARDAASIMAICETGNDTSTTTFGSGLAFYTSPYNAAQEERIRITDGGDVGIGTTNPGSKLEISSSATAPALMLTSDGGNEQFKIRRYSNNNEQLILGFHSSDYAQIQAVEQGVGYRTLSLNPNGGNVGVGTTSPGVKLDVTDAIRGRNSIRVDGAATGSPYFGLYQNGSEKAYIQYVDSGDNLTIQSDGIVTLKTGSTERMRITSGGNVGIGTTSPDTGIKLDVRGVVQAKDSYFNAGLGNTKGYNFHDFGTGWGLKGPQNPSRIALFTDTAERLTVSSGGNVGIGTTTPLAKLDIQGTQGQLFSVTDDLSGDIFSVADISGVPIMNVNSDGTSYFDGNVGIGTDSPGSKLEIYGTDSLRTHFNEGLRVTRETVPTQYGMVNYNGGALNMIAVNTAGTGSITKFMRSGNGTSLDTSMVIDNSGNVGIGTTNVDGRFEVTQSATNSAPTLIVNNGSQGSDGFTFQSWRYIENSTSYRLDLKQRVSAGIVKYAFDMVNNGTSYNSTLVLDRGNVGIGTDSPSAKLEIGSAYGDAIILKDNRTSTSGEFEHGIRFSHYNNYANGLYFQHNDYFGITKDKFLLKVGNGTKMVVDYSGNVGIGTTSPFGTNTDRTCLSVNGVSSTSLNIGTAGTQRAYLFSEGTYARLATVGALPLQLGVNDTAKMIILNSGNVGIGTTNPSKKLHLSSTANNGSDILQQTDGSRIILLEQKNGSIHWQLGTFGSTGGGANNRYSIKNATTGVEAFAIHPTNNNVGIGATSPGAKLEVNGTINFNDSGDRGFVCDPSNGTFSLGDIDGVSGEAIIANGSGSTLTFSTSGNLRMTINNNGTQVNTSTITATNFILSSDKRLKENVIPLPIKSINTEWKSFKLKTDDSYRVGVIAQELEVKHPEFVETDDEGFKSVKYIDLLIAKIAELEARLEKLEK